MWLVLTLSEERIYKQALQKMQTRSHSPQEIVHSINSQLLMLETTKELPNG